MRDYLSDSSARNLKASAKGKACIHNFDGLSFIDIEPVVISPAKWREYALFASINDKK